MKFQTNGIGFNVARVIGSVGLAFAVLLGTAALSRSDAQDRWAERAKVVQQLDGKYAETPTALGLTSNGGVIELFVTANGSTWTLVITMPNGLSTIVTSGQHWTMVPSIKGQPS